MNNNNNIIDDNDFMSDNIVDRSARESAAQYLEKKGLRVPDHAPDEVVINACEWFQLDILTLDDIRVQFQQYQNNHDFGIQNSAIQGAMFVSEMGQEESRSLMNSCIKTAAFSEYDLIRYQLDDLYRMSDQDSICNDSIQSVDRFREKYVKFVMSDRFIANVFSCEKRLLNRYSLPDMLSAVCRLEHFFSEESRGCLAQKNFMDIFSLLHGIVVSRLDVSSGKSIVIPQSYRADLLTAAALVTRGIKTFYAIYKLLIQDCVLCPLAFPHFLDNVDALMNIFLNVVEKENKGMAAYLRRLLYEFDPAMESYAESLDRTVLDNFIERRCSIIERHAQSAYSGSLSTSVEDLNVSDDRSMDFEHSSTIDADWRSAQIRQIASDISGRKLCHSPDIFENIVKKYLNFSENESLFEVDDLSQFCASSEAIIFSLGLFLKNEYVRKMPACQGLRLILYMTRYWSILVDQYDDIFSGGEFVGNGFSELLYISSAELKGGIEQCVGDLGKEGLDLQQLWMHYFEALFKAVYSNANIMKSKANCCKEAVRVCKVSKNLGIDCLGLLIAYSHEDESMQAFHTQALGELMRGIVKKLSGATDKDAKQKLFDEFKENILAVHQNFLP